MKFERRKSIATALAIASLAALTGCGSNPTPVPSGPVGVVPAPLPVAPVNMCMPISSQIGFTGTNIYIDSASIRGGYGSYGQMALTPGATGGNWIRHPSLPPGFDGLVGLNVMVNQQTQGGPMTANITGYIQITNQTTLQVLSTLYSNGYGYTYPGSVPATGAMPCVTGIAIDSGHSNNYLYDTKVSLQINGRWTESLKF